jgi:hypothetical protein
VQNTRLLPYIRRCVDTFAREGRGSLYSEMLVFVDMKRSIRIAHNNTSITLDEPFGDKLKSALSMPFFETVDMQCKDLTKNGAGE